MHPTNQAASGSDASAQSGAHHNAATAKSQSLAEARNLHPVARQEEPHGGSRPKRHWPALDGLRAIAVMAVLGIHVGVLPGGYLGVDVFFVLSGFLITSLLIGEWDQSGGRVNFRDFYARRVLRLFPALGSVVIAAVLLATMLYATGGPGDRPYAHATLSAIPWVTIFAGNVAQLLHPGSLGALGHTWSLAVEEQFYLVWPALFVFLMRCGFSRLRLALSLAVVAVAEMIYRGAGAYMGYSENRIYYGTDTHSDGLLAGCAVAFWLASKESERLHGVAERLLKYVSLPAMTIAMILFVVGNRANTALDIPVAIISSVALVIGIVLGGTPARLERVLCSRPAVWLGRRSYGFYLWHVVIIAAAEALSFSYTGIFPAGLGERRVVFALVLGSAVAASFGVTELSYRFIELPALRMKRRFQSEH